MQEKCNCKLKKNISIKYLNLDIITIVCVVMNGIEIGKYERISVENFDEFLREFDINFLLRKVASIADVEMEISSRKLRNRESSRQWTIKTSTLTKSSEIKFGVGNKFDETALGAEYESIITIEDNAFKCLKTPKEEGGKSILEFKNFYSDGCTIVMGIVGTDIICTQYFRKIE